jgi:tRNA modification GTPase
VGKSSLLNYLAGEERAIVTEIEGTTRDTLSESVRVGGVLLHLTDTAGIRQTDDKVEQIGVHRAQQALDRAELILFVIDSSRKLSVEDEEIAERIIDNLKEDKKCILLMNKTDLSSEATQKQVEELFTDRGSACPPLLFCSLQTGEGMQELGAFISELFHTGEIAEKNEIFLVNLRHQDAVKEALESIVLVEDSIENGMSEDFFSIDLMNAYRVLGTILGEAVEDDLVEEIFSKFCLGK